MRNYSELNLSNFLKGQLNLMKNEIQKEEENKILNLGDAVYSEYIINNYIIEPLKFYWDKIFITEEKRMIPAERFPINFTVVSGKEYQKEIIIYHVPFSGLINLLYYCLPKRYLRNDIIKYNGNEVYFEIINWQNNADEIKDEANRILSEIKENEKIYSNEILSFNASLREKVQELLEGRKSEIFKKNKLIRALGVPFKKAKNIPLTFNIPVVKKRPIIKPSAPSKDFSPEPVLDISAYNDILRICYDTGVEIERHPDIYVGKNEEILRDYFIMVLSPHFQSVTGETFNKNGKTDILIRHENSNVFIAECKFWSGIENYYKTINQILSYLTWRDSKSAILCFIKNKQLDPVLEQIKALTSKHDCFVRYNGKQRDGWFEFDFHLKDDNSRGVKLSVLCFHFHSLKERSI